MDGEHKPHARRRGKDEPTYVAKVALRVSPRKAEACLARFHAGTRLYNTCRAEALRRGAALREDPAFNKAKSMPAGDERKAAFKGLEQSYSFREDALGSYASGLRKSFMRKQVLAHEAQVIASQAFGAVSRWHYGKGGKPRAKSTSRGLRSMSGKDANSSLQPELDDAGQLTGLRWGRDLLLPVERPKAGASKRAQSERQERQRLEGLIASGHLLYCRIVRRKVRGRWCFEAQFVLDGRPPKRHP